MNERMGDGRAARVHMRDGRLLFGACLPACRYADSYAVQSSHPQHSTAIDSDWYVSQSFYRRASQTIAYISMCPSID